MAKSSNPDRVSLTKIEVEQLQTRLKGQNLTEEDISLLSSVLELNFWLQEELVSKNLSIKRLQKLFGFKQEKKPPPESNNTNASNQDSNVNINGVDGDLDPGKNGATNKNSGDLKALSQWDENKNHGRFGADAYKGLPIDIINHSDELLAKGSCPDCAACNSDGKLYPVPPSIVVLLKSQPLISGTRYQLERSRCRLCQKYFTAELPAANQNQSKYSSSCYTQIAIWHYYAGVPFKRLEMLQAAQGVPLSDSTQYDLMASMYKSVAEPVVGALRQVAADSPMIFIDDTPGRVVEQTLENKRATNKKDNLGMRLTPQ
jgi:transposase